MKLRVARSAAADLDEIWLYIARRESVEAAERFLTFLTDKFYLTGPKPRYRPKQARLARGCAQLPGGELPHLLSPGEKSSRANPVRSPRGPRRRETLP